MPTSKIIEKQKVVIDQLTQKLQMEDLQHLDQLRLELWPSPPSVDYSAWYLDFGTAGCVQ